jgi:hypothetical protein
VRERRRRCANGSEVGVWYWSEGLSTETINAGGRGGGAKGEVKTPNPERSRVGDDCKIEAGLLAFKSRVSTSVLVKFEKLLVWVYAGIPLLGTSFSVEV